MEKSFKYVLLTILTLSVFTLTIVELTGVSKNSLFRRFKDGGEGSFYSRDGEVFKGEIYAEQVKTRTQIVNEMPKTTMQFYETKYNFGNIGAGRVVTHVFKFKNTGQNPLMISKTDVSCGCTTPSFPLEVINPGNDGELTVVYNSEGHSGYQAKNIIVHSNALPEAISIGIEATVQ